MRNPKKGKGKKKSKPGQKPKPAAMESEEPTQPQRVWQPGFDKVGDDEALQYDPTAYDCLHTLGLDWPSLSFDIMKDELGGPRSTFPHTLYMVAGTQAQDPKHNYLAVMRLSNMGQGKHGKNADQDSDDDDMSESDGEEEPPQMHMRSYAHNGGVNRVRCMPQQPTLVATWAEFGQVQVWDVSKLLDEVKQDKTGAKPASRPYKTSAKQLHAHAAEGFALDWSHAKPGLLASGDCKRNLHVWHPSPAGKWDVSGAYKGHTESVEDIQWSPLEENVLASCSVDKTIRIWDTRERGQPMVTINAHATDVNVISWSRKAEHMLASGGDDGSLRVWDLRAVSQEDTAFVANFTYHRGPVTSVEWSPHEESVLVTSSSDGQVAVWDLSLERDPEEEAAMSLEGNAEAPEGLPPQLLFVHSGQSDLKEAHWHMQIPGLLLTTAADGFNVFKPANV